MSCMAKSAQLSDGKKGAMHKTWDWELIYQWVLTMYFLRFSVRIYSLANHIFPPCAIATINLCSQPGFKMQSEVQAQ